MKPYFIALITALMFSGSATFAQCIINYSNTTPGVTPANPNDTITRGIAYSQTLQLYAPASYNGATVDSIHISSITGAPSGINYVINPVSGTFAGGANGAICFNGTTTGSVGAYPLTFNGTAYFTIFGNHSSIPLSQESQFSYTFYVKDSTVPLHPPVAAFTANDTITCAGNYIQFTDQSSNNPTSWNWTFTGGNPPTSNIADPLVYYASSGNYNVKLVVHNSDGADSITKTVHIKANPSGTITVQPVTGNANAINGMAIVTATGGTPPYSYLWTGNASTTDTLSAGQGTYYVTVTDYYGCLAFDSAVINLAQPAAAFSFDTLACVNTTVTFTDQSTNSPSAWHWAFTGGTPPTAADSVASVTYADTGYFTIKLVVINDGGTDSITKHIHIVGNPSGTITINPVTGNTSSLTGSAIVTAGNGTAPYTYSWSANGGSSDTLSNVGLGQYIVTITDNNGCKTIDTAIVTMAPPVAAFTYDSIGCTNTWENFTSQSTNSPTGYIWTFAGGYTPIDTIAVPSVKYDNPGYFTVKLVVSNSGGSDSITKIIHVYKSPVDSLTIIPATGATGATNGSVMVTAFSGTPPYTYFWEGHNDTTNTLSNVAAGLYYIIVTDSNGCQVISPGLVSFINAVEQLTIAPVKIYPNPASNVLNILWPEKTDAELSVIDMNGKTITSYTIKDASKGAYDIRLLSPGTYILRVTDNVSHLQQSILFTNL